MLRRRVICGQSTCSIYLLQNFYEAHKKESEKVLPIGYALSDAAGVARGGGRVDAGAPTVERGLQ